MIEANKAVVVQVGMEDYAIPIQNVISIEKVESITPIPHLPDYVKGIVEVRGDLIPVIDFENVLYNRSLLVSEISRLIVLKTDEISLAILVNDAKEIVDIPPEKLKQVGLLAYSKTSYFSVVANLDHRLITLIDSSALVNSLEGISEIKDYMCSHQ
jgi:purine-binding chemotaxis protein CheW